MEDWVYVPLLVCLQKMEEAPMVDNLVRIIMEAVVDGGNLDGQAKLQNC